MTKKSYYEWERSNIMSTMRKDEDGYCHRGSGVGHAFQAGAEMALRKEPFRSSYQRADCKRAFALGYELMQAWLQDGNSIVCDCCGTEISEALE